MRIACDEPILVAISGDGFRWIKYVRYSNRVSGDTLALSAGFPLWSLLMSRKPPLPNFITALARLT